MSENQLFFSGKSKRELQEELARLAKVSSLVKEDINKYLKQYFIDAVIDYQNSPNSTRESLVRVMESILLNNGLDPEQVVKEWCKPEQKQYSGSIEQNISGSRF